MKTNKESTPNAILEDHLNFAKDLGLEPPVYVTVSPPPDADVGDRADNLARQYRRLGGTMSFGRALASADDLYLVGEWHSVIRTPQGLVDVTPNPMGEKPILYAEHIELPKGKGLIRPTIRARIYGAAERHEELESKIREDDDAARATALKNGITVRQLMLSRLPRDQLAAQIDEYLRAEAKVENMIMDGHNGERDWDPSQIAGLDAEFARLDRRRAELYLAADLHKRSDDNHNSPR
jgi:hypothetical protein